MAEGHRERLRRRFLNEEIDSIPEYIVLEMMLQGVIARKDTCGMARSLLEKFGSLANVIDAPLSEIMKVPGIGDAAAYQLKLLPKFYRKYKMSRNMKNVPFDSVETIGQYFVDRSIGYNEETMFLACLDARMRLIECEQVASGSINSMQISTRKIVEVAMKYNASRVVLAHTHPGGSVLPSIEDIESTEVIEKALWAADIRLEDHIIVAGDDYVSIMQSRDRIR